MINRNQVILVLLWLLLGISPLIDGFVYYLSPLHERPYLAVHEAFKPSGIIGQGLGIFGSLMIIVGVASYSMRKRMPVLARFGRLRTWLTFHIFLCTLGPFYILLHTTFKIGNIASISFWSMTVVVLSGIFGRYVYVHIPKSAAGHFLEEPLLLDEQEALISQFRKQTGLAIAEVNSVVQRFRPSASSKYFDALWSTIRFDLSKSGLQREMDEQLRDLGIAGPKRAIAVPLLFRNARIDQQRIVSEPFKALFGYWHVLHIPLAIVMLITFLVHVGAAIAFGYTWIF